MQIYIKQNGVGVESLKIVILIRERTRILECFWNVFTEMNIQNEMM